MIQAVIFDLDGTLIDSESVTIAAGTAAFAAHGYAVGADLFHRLVGVDELTGAGLLRAMLGDDLPLDRINADWAAGSRRLYDAHGVPVKPGARDLLRLLRARSLPLAVATSSGRRSALWKLEQSGLAAHFDTVVTLDCITRPKPAPDPYLEAARRLGADPAQCVAFEDSETGAASAQAAGMTVVQVPDVVAPSGRHARHIAPDLLSGARAAGLI
jgi:HAD superfamily hydrolase (TIGR01509 family)